MGELWNKGVGGGELLNNGVGGGELWNKGVGHTCFKYSYFGVLCEYLLTDCKHYFSI